MTHAKLWQGAWIAGLLLVAAPAVANIPAAYLACKDKALGDACRLVGPQYGECVLDTLCVDTPEIETNECVLCVDGCWGKLDGDPCLQAATNEPGVCALQDRCTDRPSTSFAECNRCVPGEVSETTPSDGCSAGPATLATVPWIFILLALGWQLRRRKARG